MNGKCADYGDTAVAGESSPPTIAQIVMPGKCEKTRRGAEEKQDAVVKLPLVLTFWIADAANPACWSIGYFRGGSK